MAIVATRHGDASNHNRRPSPEYQAWVGMVRRCHYEAAPNFPAYGGRGISVCDEWRNSYIVFREHAGRRPSSAYSLDRINNDGNYEPGNVRWATRKQQANNVRSNYLIAFSGRTQTVTQWADELGVHADLVFRRLAAGWSEERALTQPRRR
jgi:hypothetical protein